MRLVTIDQQEVEARISNRFVSEKLSEVADLLEKQGANRFRVRAFREAAFQVANMSRPVAQILAEGSCQALVDLPYIGTSIAAAIEEMVKTGQLSLIARLRRSVDPEKLFQTVPGIGPKLAELIHQSLEIETLEELEASAYDGRLAKVGGIGPRRVRSIQYALAEILAQRRPGARPSGQAEPPIGLVLDVDDEYRSRAEANDLPLITPRRFNPSGVMRLPILHTEHKNWRFTALFSNTPQAHRLDRTKDWVVIYFERDHAPEGQCTVVTESRGELSGRRVVRGREAACLAHYLAQS